MHDITKHKTGIFISTAVGLSKSHTFIFKAKTFFRNLLK